MDILKAIIAERRSDVVNARRSVPVSALEDKAKNRVYRSLAASLALPGTRIMAEVKKASPSAGQLVRNYRPGLTARAYEQAGAAAISVLTEPRHFMGDVRHLHEVRNATNLPVLRKDFICDVYQLHEAAAWGADVVLLIVAALEKQELNGLCLAARAMGLEVLVESHSEDELDTALALEGAIIGVNSRDLKTLTTDLAVARRLAERIPRDRIAVAESGIKTRQDIVDLQAAGYRGFLVGETLLRSSDPAAALRTLLGGTGGVQSEVSSPGKKMIY